MAFCISGTIPDVSMGKTLGATVVFSVLSRRTAVAPRPKQSQIPSLTNQMELSHV